MEQIKIVAQAINEGVYYALIALSVYQRVKLIVDFWLGAARIKAEIDQSQINRKKYSAMLETIEDPAPPNTEKRMFSESDCALTWL